MDPLTDPPTVAGAEGRCPRCGLWLVPRPERPHQRMRAGTDAASGESGIVREPAPENPVGNAPDDQ
jgi:hypothetical protein